MNADILGEYWLSYLIPNWLEYGTAKSNLRAGLTPPLTGAYENLYGYSNGAFIRSEIWACLAPGQPQIAVKYAYEDASVDHCGEGIHGEVFCAALQSAAFVEKDKRKLIDIALTYIPEESAVARCVREAIACYEEKIPVEQARFRIHNTAPGTFGVQILRYDRIPELEDGYEVGTPGFDAAENVGYVIAGWLYGEDDFGKALTTALSFGEDTDCTCTTLGALMGIILGESALPEKWKIPLDDKISTMCIDKTSGGVWVPETGTELTERILRAAPVFMGPEGCDLLAEDGYEMICRDPDQLVCPHGPQYVQRINANGIPHELSGYDLCSLSSYTVRRYFPAFEVFADYMGSIAFCSGQERQIRIAVYNDPSMKQQHWVQIQLYVPDGVTVSGGNTRILPLNSLSGSKAEVVFTIHTEEFTQPKLDIIADISLVGRHSDGCVKLTLLRKE